jgi:hypothetical protein
MEERTKLEPALDELLVGKSAEEIAGPGGLLKQLTKALLERAMNAELMLPPDSDGVHPHKNHRRSALKRDFQEAAGRGGPGGLSARLPVRRIQTSPASLWRNLTGWFVSRNSEMYEMLQVDAEAPAGHI